MQLKNQDIRAEIAQNDLKLWEIADRYGCADATFSRKLRKEFKPEEKEKIRAIIKELKGCK